MDLGGDGQVRCREWFAGAQAADIRRQNSEQIGRSPQNAMILDASQVSIFDSVIAVSRPAFGSHESHFLLGDQQQLQHQTRM